MRKIDKEQFAYFSIYGKGWSVSFYDLTFALNKWKEVPADGTHSLIGTKKDGEKAILDMK